jgi:hypothetical protein
VRLGPNQAEEAPRLVLDQRPGSGKERQRFDAAKTDAVVRPFAIPQLPAYWPHQSSGTKFALTSIRPAGRGTFTMRFQEWHHEQSPCC